MGDVELEAASLTSEGDVMAEVQALGALNCKMEQMMRLEAEYRKALRQQKRLLRARFQATQARPAARARASVSAAPALDATG